MTKKLLALLAATVVVGLSLGYGAPNAPAQGKGKPAQTKACCGHCGMKK